MVVRAINQNDGNSRLHTVIKSTAAGTAAGYAMKYIWPVTQQENDMPERVILNACRKATNNAKADEFEKLGTKSEAQKSFIQMVKDPKTLEQKRAAFTPESLKARVETLGGESSDAGKEFRGIIRSVNEESSQMAKKLGLAYKMMLKHIRPVVPFLVAGAGIGFFTGFTHNVLKTDYYA